MKKITKKILSTSLMGICLATAIFAQPQDKRKRPEEFQQKERFVKPGIMKFNELEGILHVEKDGNNQKIYITTKNNKKVSVETINRPRFDNRTKDFENKKFDNKKQKENKKNNKKDFSRMPKEKSKDFPKMQKDESKDFPKMQREKSKDFSKNKMPTPQDFICDIQKDFMPSDELITLNGKPVDLIGKYDESKNTFIIFGLIEK